MIKKRVSFSNVEVREYGCTVGDHPMCSDGLPISLDWSHEHTKIIDIECSRERTSFYRFPPRLSYDDRKRRIFGDEGRTFEGWWNYWTQATVSAKALPTPTMPQGHGFEMNVNEIIEPNDDDEYAFAKPSKRVIYCRHAIREKSSNLDYADDDDDSINFFTEWRARLTGTV